VLGMGKGKWVYVQEFCLKTKGNRILVEAKRQ